MLFSNDQIARFINEHFEPVWQSVRAVPIVKIDFGDGNVVTRTLHGNVATYVCTAEGNVLDILPGLYEPEAYRNQLIQLDRLFRLYSQSGARAEAVVRDYHRRQAEALRDNRAAEILTEVSQGLSITGSEIGTKIILQPAQRLHARSRAAAGRPLLSHAARMSDTSDRVAGDELLRRDTVINESIRRRWVHEYLAEKGLVTPEDITRWLYREVLKADLDDPYMGLGKLLFTE